MEGRRILESWKEISAYLKRSVRTCRRWESGLGLPIHRLDGTPSARVFAYPEELDRWLEEKLNHTDAESEEARRPKGLTSRRLLAFGIGIVILTVAGLLARHLFPPALLPIPENKPSVAIVPFVNTSGDEALERWRTALPDLIITDLTQSRFVNVVRITDLYRNLRALGLDQAVEFSDEDIRKIAAKADVTHVATGSLAKVGPNITISISVRNSKTGEAVGAPEAGWRNKKGIFDAADTLTKKIKLSLGLEPRFVSRDVDKPVSRVSTNSPEAFCLFSRGYRLAGIDKYPESISLLQRAVEVDPEFALAYKYLWRACINSRREDDETRYVRMAVDRSDRLSEKERGDLRILFYTSYEKDPVKERKALERLCLFHPDDRFGSRRLASSYVDQEEWERALPIAQRGWSANKAELILCLALVRCYLNLDSADKAEKVLDEFIESFPDNPNFHMILRTRMMCHLYRNDVEAALGDAERLSSLFPNDTGLILEKGMIFLHQDDFPAAEREFRRACNQADPFVRIEGHAYMRDLYLTQGKIEAAKDELRQGLEIAEKIEGQDRKARATKNGLKHDLAYLYRLSGEFAKALKEAEEVLRPPEKPSPDYRPSLEALHQKALILLDMNRMDEFGKLVGEIKDWIGKRYYPKMMRVYYHLLGCAELKNKNTKKAIGHFSKALDLLSVPGPDLYRRADPQYFYSLAEAYVRSDTTLSTRALQMYEKVTLPTASRLLTSDLYARSFMKMAEYYDSAAFDIGTKVDEMMTDKKKAIENYRKFLALWKDADPIFVAEVNDAKNRLAALESR
jgi:tetratricopeptide (TPR) repeat protein